MLSGHQSLSLFNLSILIARVSGCPSDSELSFEPDAPECHGDLGGRDTIRVVRDQTQQEDAVGAQEALDELADHVVVADRSIPLHHLAAQAEPETVTSTSLVSDLVLVRVDPLKTGVIEGAASKVVADEPKTIAGYERPNQPDHAAVHRRNNRSK